MSHEIKTYYRQARARGVPASSPLALAKARVTRRERQGLDWKHSSGYGRPLKSATLMRDGFEVSVRVDYDEIGDLSHLGEFTDNPKGAVKRKKIGWNEYKYFRPATSYEEHRRALSKLGYSRQAADVLARKYMRQDAEYAEEFARGDRSLLVVEVQVSKMGVELGFESVGGVDVDDLDDPYLDELAEDLIPSALHEAKQKLQKLCEGVCG